MTSENEKAPAGATARAKHDDPNYQEGITMTQNTVPQTTRTEKSTAYASEMRAARARAMKPMGLDDPRRQQLARVTGRTLDFMLDFDEEHLADIWWEQVAEKPPLPMDAPSWAVETEVSSWEYPEVGVTYRGRKWITVDEDGVEYGANLVLGVTVFVEDKEDGAAGDILVHDRVAIECNSINDVLSLSGAMQLSIVLADAAQELRKVEEAGR